VLTKQFQFPLTTNVMEVNGNRKKKVLQKIIFSVSPKKKKKITKRLCRLCVCSNFFFKCI